MTWFGSPLAVALLGAALACIALSAYAYVGYPLLVRWLLPPRRLPERPELADPDLPRMSVLIAARNEAAVIGRRIENLLGQDYPAEKIEVLVVSDASDDGTDEIVLGFGDPRVRLIRQEPRAGKTAGLNLLGPEASGSILVQTDANTVFHEKCLRVMGQAFRHPEVGLVLGEIHLTNVEDPDVASGEGFYWRFENWTKSVEAERGVLCVSAGAAYALRRETWRKLPIRISGDAAEPLMTARAGLRTIVAKGAHAYEQAAVTVGEELERKSRIISQQVACARWIGLSTLPTTILWAYVSHKLLRYTVPILWAASFLLALGSGLASSWLGAALALATLLPLALVPLAWLPLRGRLGRLAHVPLYLVSLQVASLRGLVRGLSGRADAHWETPESVKTQVAR